MTKRLTKALRGKRRWVGVVVDGNTMTRSSVEEGLVRLAALVELPPPRLMDFVPVGGNATLRPSELLLPFSRSPHGVAILQIPLGDVTAYRRLLEPHGALELHGLQCLTSSGKIRLVRLRLGLPKPPRRRR
jgi:hypothetical protein